MIEALGENKAVVLTSVFVLCFCLLSALEILRPRREPAAAYGWRWLNNLTLAVVSALFGRAIYLGLALASGWWASKNFSGLLDHVQPGLVGSLLIGVLVLDLTHYLTHRLLHASPLLWRVHAVHHSDTDCDLTTALRNHPVEAAIVLIIRLPVLMLLGLPPVAVAFYEAIALLQNLHGHSNVRWPARLDRMLRVFVVTPDFHRVHHMNDRRLTDSNYATVLSIWDQMFDTQRQIPFHAHENAEIGLSSFRDLRSTRLDQLLLMPFRATSPGTGPNAQCADTHFG